MLQDYFFLDPRVILVPAEHLSERGVDASFGAALRDRAGWGDAQLRLLNEGFTLFWSRAATLAERLSHLRAPLRRSVAVLRAGSLVRPYAPILNRSTWTVHEEDLDPARSHPELLAYALLHADRAAELGEVTRPALDLAPYWLLRSEPECNAFVDAARRSAGPERDVFRLIADALPWIRELRHESLRPPRLGRHRKIPGTGVLVPQRHETRPPELVQHCRAIAHERLARHHAAIAGSGETAKARLLEWLRTSAPPLLVTSSRDTVVWEPDSAAETRGLERALAGVPAAAIDSIQADLERIASHTQCFQEALADPDSLARTSPEAEQRGYAFLHRERGCIAYDLLEPEIERLRSPALPYAREMLGARTWHEWAHLADDAGYVIRTVDERRWQTLAEGFGALLDRAVDRAARAIRSATAADLEALAGEGSPGQRLGRLFLTRLPDYRANLLACRFMSEAERETYVRQNVRPLHREYGSAQSWRLLVRLLYEAQYLRFSEMDAPAEYLREAVLRHDVLDAGLVEQASWEELYAAAGALCEAHTIDAARFRSGRLPPRTPTSLR